MAFHGTGAPASSRGDVGEIQGDIGRYREIWRTGELEAVDTRHVACGLQQRAWLGLGLGLGLGFGV